MATETSETASGPDSPTGPSGWSTRIHAIDDRWLELIAVLLLATASLAAAWSGYQASRWGGVQSTLYSQAGAARVESTRASTTGYLRTVADLEIFNGWAEAYATENELLLDFYENRFTPELQVAMDAWLATQPLQNPDAPSGPLQMEEYRQPDLERSLELEAEAERLFAEGREANQQGDDYVLTTVFLATVLFFAGISARVTTPVIKVGVIAFALAMLLYSLYRLATFPIT
jgi:hypothetical protein